MNQKFLQIALVFSIFHVSFENNVIAQGKNGLSSAAVKAIPSLDGLAGSWYKAADLQSFPAINSVLGSAQATGDILSIGNLSFPPITMTGESGKLLVNDQSPQLDQVRWYPYQVLRKGSFKELGIQTAVRLDDEQRGVLFHVVFTNNSKTPQTYNIQINLSAHTSRHEKWGWKVPREIDSSHIQGTKEGANFLVKNTTGSLINCFAFEQQPSSLKSTGSGGLVIWRLTIRPGEKKSLNYALAIGENKDSVQAMAGAWVIHFDKNFKSIQHNWQARFNAMFTPGNSCFSGHLPILATGDKKMCRMYYMSAVSILSVLRINFPIASRVYVSNGPESNCTMMYFWDTSEWAVALALLDPDMLKIYLRDWLGKGIYNGYAEEYLTGSLQGPWYSANDLSVFRLLDAYLNVTGDHAFLSENIKGKTVLDHMDAIANNWKTLVRSGRNLADYGGAPNLLECVPTYINEVASFNAANIWMMRRVASLQEQTGRQSRAADLRAGANSLFSELLKLYQPGEGVWNAFHRDGSTIPIRHVFDFATIGLTIKEDLTPAMRQEMIHFVETELLTDHWMRAQSLSDIAASVSNRPDHGPMGAYCAWPSETIGVMCGFGAYDKALDFLRRCEAVTYEGPFSQSRVLLNKSPDAGVRIVHGPQTYNASNGGGFLETIIRGFFGYEPDFLKHPLVTDALPRGFKGQLYNIKKEKGLYEIASTQTGIRVKPMGSSKK